MAAFNAVAWMPAKPASSYEGLRTWPCLSQGCQNSSTDKKKPYSTQVLVGRALICSSRTSLSGCREPMDASVSPISVVVMSRLLVLIVDDDLLVRLNAAFLLEDAGFDAIEAGNCR